MSIRSIRLAVLVSGRGSNLQAIVDAVRAGRLQASVEVVVSDVADAPAVARARAYANIRDELGEDLRVWLESEDSALFVDFEYAA